MLNEDVPPYCLPNSAKVTIRTKTGQDKGRVVAINNPMLECVVNLGWGADALAVAEEDVRLVLRVGNLVQVRDASGNFVDARVESIKDNSQYVIELADKEESVLVYRKNLTYLEDEDGDNHNELTSPKKASTGKKKQTPEKP